MGRYARHDASERRTAFFGFQLSPTERAELVEAARQQGATPSAYARECLFRRSAAVVAATRRNPEAAAVKRELETLGEHLYRIGNNINQLAYQANSTGYIRSEDALQAALAELAQIDALVCRAVEKVIGQ